jgi:CheY-like chemotaxis protein
VFLPWVDVEATIQEAPSPKGLPADAPHPATILLAEDEEMVRYVTARVLGRAGYVVVEATDGEQALQLARSHRPPIDMVISDVVMAKLGGVELARRLTHERPEVPVLLVSGYNREEIPGGDEEGRAIGFLQKPFTPRELLQKVASLLIHAHVH